MLVEMFFAVALMAGVAMAAGYNPQLMAVTSSAGTSKATTYTASAATTTASACTANPSRVGGYILNTSTNTIRFTTSPMASVTQINAGYMTLNASTATDGSNVFKFRQDSGLIYQGAIRFIGYTVGGVLGTCSVSVIELK